MSATPPHLLFSSRGGDHLYLAARSQLYDLPDGWRDDLPLPSLLTDLARPGRADPDFAHVPEPEPQHLSLNVSSSCNLACSYCYAGQGGFGGRQAAAMRPQVARAAVDRLLAGADRRYPVTVGFIGGEPFVGRPLIHDVVAYASERAARLGFDLRFSVTTNATLLTDRDRELLRAHPFAVTVSIDGDRATHDAARPATGGRGSWDRTVAAIAPLLAEPGRARIAARATVRRGEFDLIARFDALRAAGFSEIGFSPLRRSPDRGAAIAGDAWQSYLDALTAVARAELDRAARGEPIRLTNLAVALKEIERGAASPFPCGAGGGYFSVAADGGWYACHRAIGDDEYLLGDNSGLDRDRRRHFLAARHVDAEVDCRACWARTLCSGGCHQEKSERSAQSCDFVRGWLSFCLAAFCEGAGSRTQGE